MYVPVATLIVSPVATPGLSIAPLIVLQGLAVLVQELESFPVVATYQVVAVATTGACVMLAEERRDAPVNL